MPSRYLRDNQTYPHLREHGGLREKNHLPNLKRMFRHLHRSGIHRHRLTMPCNSIATDTSCTIAGGAVNMAPAQTFPISIRAAHNTQSMVRMAASTCRKIMLHGYTILCNFTLISSSIND